MFFSGQHQRNSWWSLVCLSALQADTIRLVLVKLMLCKSSERTSGKASFLISVRCLLIFCPNLHLCTCISCCLSQHLSCSSLWLTCLLKQCLTHNLLSHNLNPLWGDFAVVFKVFMIDLKTHGFHDRFENTRPANWCKKQLSFFPRCGIPSTRLAFSPSPAGQRGMVWNEERDLDEVSGVLFSVRGWWGAGTAA